jgi:hypothetical protein
MVFLWKRKDAHKTLNFETDETHRFFGIRFFTESALCAKKELINVD